MEKFEVQVECGCDQPVMSLEADSQEALNVLMESECPVCEQEFTVLSTNVNGTQTINTKIVTLDPVIADIG